MGVEENEDEKEAKMRIKWIFNFQYLNKQRGIIRVDWEKEEIGSNFLDEFRFWVTHWFLIEIHNN